MRDAGRVSHSGLPSPADLFVGRDGELEAVSRMLADPQARLVTLTGPPGIGKTRLGVVCASAHAERSGCAAVFVDLAPVRDPALVMAELAQAMGVEPRGGTDLTGQLAAAPTLPIPPPGTREGARCSFDDVSIRRRGGQRRTGTTGVATGRDASSSSCPRSPPSRTPRSHTTISSSGACIPPPGSSLQARV